MIVWMTIIVEKISIIALSGPLTVDNDVFIIVMATMTVGLGN